MKLLISTLLVLGTLSAASPALAVDNSISPLCRAENAGSGYQRPGGFCDALATNGTMVPKDQGVGITCESGEVLVNKECECAPA